MISFLKNFNLIWGVLLLVTQINAAPNQNYNPQNGYSNQIQQQAAIQVPQNRFMIPIVEAVSQPSSIVCPELSSFYVIQNVCREYLPDREICKWNYCQQANEECLPVNEYSQGTCQCKVGYYHRNPSSYECVKQMPPIANDQSGVNLYETDQYEKLLERRRPDIKEVEPNKEEIELENKFFKQVIDQISKEDKKVVAADSAENYRNKKVLDLLQYNTNTEKSKSEFATTTATTEVQTISTDNLIVNAGVDIHVYHPSKVCVLNGTLTKFKTVNNAQEFVTKWIWTKLDSSPAFGKFKSSNEGDVVVYENLVEGVYRFRLQVWTNTNEFSQDTVRVFVHSSYIASKSNNNNSTSLELIYKNLIQIELDYKPNEFSQITRNTFLTRLEALLKHSEFSFNNLKVILVNTRVSNEAKRSNVMLEFFVCEDIGIETANSSNVFDFTRFASLLEHASFTDAPLPNVPQLIINSKDIVGILKHKSLGKLIDTTLEYLKKLPVNDLKKNDQPEELMHYSELHIMEVSLLTCMVGNMSTGVANGGECSDHGECDRFSGKCVCDKYWMLNLYLYYLRNDRDLTSGNNCDWNIPLVIMLSILIVIVTTVILNMLLKHVFFYLFCCCLCRRRDPKANFRNKLDKSYRKEKYSVYNQKKKISNESDIDESDICDEDADKLLNSSTYSDENKQFQKVAFKKFLKNFRSTSSKNYKYAVLADQEDMQLTDCRRSRRQNSDDEEDVVYDKKTSPKIKEYKNII